MIELEQIKQKIKEQVAELMNLDVASISDQDLLIEDLGADSIVMVQLFVSCQEEYHVTLSEELDLSAGQSIEQIAQMIQDKMKESQNCQEK